MFCKTAWHRIFLLVTFLLVFILILQKDYDRAVAPLTSRYLHSNEDNSDGSTSPLDEQHSLFPLTSRDIWGFTAAICGLMMAAGGGIGGGGILVPIYIFVLKFPPKHAIPLSNVTVFGGAVANTLVNCRKRHPLADRPLIDWDLILMMEPMTIAGALAGASINKVLPQSVIVIMLALMLSATAYKTLDKACKLYRTESASLRWTKVETEQEVDGDDATIIELTNLDQAIAIVEPEDSDGDRVVSFNADEKEDVPERFLDATKRSLIHTQDDGLDHAGKTEKLSHSRPSSNGVISILFAVDEDDVSSVPSCLSSDAIRSQPYDEDDSTPEALDGAKSSARSSSYLEPSIERGDSHSIGTNPLLQHILDEERHTPIRNVITIVALFLVVLNLNIIKGGGAFSSPVGIECGSLTFWLAEAFMLTCIVIVSVAARTILIHRTRTKLTVNYPYVEGDIIWTSTATIIYPAISGVAGVASGLFGIGGGIVKGPLMLAMGVHPAVSAATSACMIFFTSFTATTSYVVYGLLVTDYALALLLTGFLATLVGQTVMSMLLRAYNRNSYIAFSIGIVVTLSAILLTIESLVKTEPDHDDSGSKERFGGLCSKRIP